jgi:hypothetical protein
MRSADGLSVCIYLYHAFDIPIRKRRNVVCILKVSVDIFLCRGGCRVMKVVCAQKAPVNVFSCRGGCRVMKVVYALKGQLIIAQGSALGFCP